MRELGLNSHTKMLETAENLQKSISEKSDKIKDLYAEIPKLKAKISELRSEAPNDPNAHADEIKNLQKRLQLIPIHAKALTNEMSDAQTKLGRVNAVLQTYERIVEGNYIDNMIKAEREKQAKAEKKQTI